jgi:hypothetical protein
MTHLSTREKKFLFIIVSVALVLRLALIFRSEALIYSRPYFDDTFYATGCAYHLANGQGLTSDGVHPTNGIQPLIVFLDVPLFAIAGADKLLGLRLTILLEAIIDTLSVYLFALLIARLRKKPEDEPTWRSAPIIGAFLWTVLFNMIRQTMNGLETGLFSMLILVCFLVYSRMRDNNEERLLSWAGLGALLGILVLARIDGVFIVGAFVVVKLWRKGFTAIPRLFVMGITAILVSSPWWVFNYLRFGSIMPMSGQSEALGINFGANLFDGAVALADIFSAFFYFPFQSLPGWTRWLWAAVVPLTALLLALRFGLFKKLREKYELGKLAPLGVASLGFIVFYVFYFAAWWFLNRYFQPLRILWLVMLAIGLSEMFNEILQMTPASQRVWKTVVIIFLVGAGAWNVERYADNFRNHNIAPGYLTGKWGLQHPNLLIGMEQAGTARFVAPNIVNLDGKVNPEALQARRHHAIGEYIVQTKFDYLVDWPFIVGPLVEHANAAGEKYTFIGKITTMDVYHRDGAPEVPLP